VEQFRTTVKAAKALRVDRGSLITEERLGLTGRKTEVLIRENPYLQYFIALKAYQNEASFDASSKESNVSSDFLRYFGTIRKTVAANYSLTILDKHFT